MPRRIEASAPARANLIGNPSDQYGGCTLACSVALRARVTLDDLHPGRIRSGDECVEIRSAGDLLLRGDGLDLGRAALVHRGLHAPGFGIAYESEIPRQSGMAGSTALMVALVAAIDAWQGRRRSRAALAEAARSAEAFGMGIQCGFVDQYACSYGGLVHVDLRGKSFGQSAGAPYATVEELGAEFPELPFVLAYTGVRHSSDSVHRPIRERWLGGESAVIDGYARVAEIGVEGKSALQRGDWDRLGRLMNENHAIQRGLGGSGESNERLISAALAAGAAGAKLAGAGDGGTIVALWQGAGEEALVEALREAGCAAIYRPSLEAGVRVEVAPD